MEDIPVELHLRVFSFLHIMDWPLVSCVSRHWYRLSRFVWKRRPYRYETFTRQAELGSVPAIQWLLEQGVKPSDHALVTAAKHGHLECVKSLFAASPSYADFSGKAIIAAGRQGHYDIVEYLLPRYPTHACIGLAERGSLGKLIRLKVRGVNIQRAFGAACGAAHYDIMDWMLYNGYLPDTHCVKHAILKNRSDVLDWIGRVMGEKGMGSLDKLLSTEDCLSHAMKAGSVVLAERFKHANWHESMIYSAIRRGHVHMLQWAKDNNLELPYHIPIAAVEFCKVEILDWCVRDGRKLYASELCEKAALLGHISVLDWLRNRGIVWEIAYISAADASRIEVLEWMLNTNYPIDLNGIIARSEYHDIDKAAKWARECIAERKK
jgi:hypothetical protein